MRRFNIILICISLCASLISISTENNRLQHIVYNTYDYTNKCDTYKEMVIYLPKNYSTNDKYDVLFMLPGLYFGANYWLDTSEGRIDAKETIDTMIENKECEPFIAVSISAHPNQYQ